MPSPRGGEDGYLNPGTGVMRAIKQYRATIFPRPTITFLS